MKKPLTKPTVKLIGHDGNAFSIMGRVKKALMQAGADKEYIEKYLKESTAGDYSYLSDDSTLHFRTLFSAPGRTLLQVCIDCQSVM